METDRRTVLKAGMGAVTLFFDIGRHAAAGAQANSSVSGRPSLNDWIRVAADTRVTVFTGKAEIGQGILTALTQIAADELDVAPRRIDIVSADTSLTPNEGYTAGSMSVQTSGMAIRQAAAELRHILLRLAAQQLGVPPEALVVADGTVSGDDRRISYWRLAADANISAEVSGRVAPKAPGERRLAGRAMPRIDIPAKAFGESRFLHDLRLPGMLHGRVVRPPSYGQRLRAVDAARVETLPGIEAVVRDGSFLGVLARREHEAVAAAEALREAAAWDGETLLPAAEELADFIRHHPKAAHEVIAESGAPTDAGERHAARYFRPYQAHASLGPSVALAAFDDNRLTVWSHSQGVFPLRGALAEALGMEPGRVQVIHREGAGCYGHNGADDVALDAALLARAAGGRPVRVQWMRQDEFRWEPFGAAMVVDVAATLDATTGDVGGWDYGVWGFPHSSRPGGGAGNLLAERHLARPFTEPPAFEIPRPRGGLDRNAVPPYRFPRVRVVKHLIAESPLRVSALRGLGAYTNVFATESFMDELAAAAGIDPLAFRLKHLPDARARAVVEAVADMSGWSQGGGARDGTGRGLAFARYKNIGGYLAVVATVEVDPRDGQVHVRRADAVVDCGETINPDGLKNQVEGGLIQATSWTLGEAVRFSSAGIVSEDWASYPVLRFPEVPRVAVQVIGRAEDPPLGAGEVAQGPMAAAISNAVYDALGVRLRELPMLPDRVKAEFAGRTRESAP